MRPMMLVLLTISAMLAPAFADAQRTERGQRTDPRAVSHYRSGLQLMGSERWDQAAAEFSAAIDIAPQFELAHYWLGRARIANGNYVAAIQALEACRDLYMEQLGTRASDQLAAQQQREDQLREIREMIRERQGGRQGAGTDRVILHLENLAKDIEWQKTMGSNMDFHLSVPAFVSLSLGSAHFRKGEMATAEEYYLQAVDANPKMGEAHNNLAVVYLMTSRLDDAERSMKAAERNGFRVNPQLKDQLKEAQRRR
jgi:tetratricopeptide (TPR) repeat protein